jgi:hypothetical protein
VPAARTGQLWLPSVAAEEVRHNVMAGLLLRASPLLPCRNASRTRAVALPFATDRLRYGAGSGPPAVALVARCCVRRGDRTRARKASGDGAVPLAGPDTPRRHPLGGVGRGRRSFRPGGPAITLWHSGHGLRSRWARRGAKGLQRVPRDGLEAGAGTARAGKRRARRGRVGLSKVCGVGRRPPGGASSADLAAWMWRVGCAGVVHGGGRHHHPHRSRRILG